MPEAPGSPPTIRTGTLADSAVLLAWRNEPASRQSSLQPHPLRIDEHEAWLEERLARPHPMLWMLDVDGVARGTVRLDQASPTVATVSIAVDPDSRGLGYGQLLLAFLDVQSLSLGIVELHATIHPDNTASARLFTSAGYLPQPSSEPGFDSYAKPVTAR